MLRPRAVASYLPEHSIVADELWDHVISLRNQDNEVKDLRPELDKYAAECKKMIIYHKFRILRTLILQFVFNMLALLTLQVLVSFALTSALVPLRISLQKVTPRDLLSL